MADVKWIKIATNIFDNRKIKQIECLPDGDGIIVAWLKLLCLAGQVNDSGLVYFTKEIPYTDQMLASQFNMPIATIQMALKVFEQFGMIEIINDILHISNWEKYQNTDGLDKIREQNRLRKQKQRSQNLLPDMSRDMSRDRHVTVTQCHATDIDKEEDIDKEGDIDNISSAQKRKRFVKPSIEDIKAYCSERNNSVDTQRFYDYYESNGWKVGRNAMKDWKAAVRTWEKGEKNGVYKGHTEEKSESRRVFGTLI